MADIVSRVARGFEEFFKRYRDMGDGTHAEVVAAAGIAPLSTVTGTITSGASLSGAIELRTMGTPVALQTDAAWDTNAITFQGSYDGVVYTNLRNMGVEVSIPGVVASSLEGLDLQQFLGLRFIKVRSGTAAAAVNQVGDTVITLVCGQIWSA